MEKERSEQITESSKKPATVPAGGVRKGFREKRVFELGHNGEVGVCWVWGDW